MYHLLVKKVLLNWMNMFVLWMKVKNQLPLVESQTSALCWSSSSNFYATFLQSLSKSL